MFRKQAQDYILNLIEDLSPGTENKKHYQDFFAKMNDKQFHQYMADIKSGKSHLSVQLPNWSKNKKRSVKELLAIAQKMKHEFFQRLYITDEETGVRYLTPTTNMVLMLPIRRPSQLLTKKISVPEDHKVVNAITGQATGASKGARMSKPELEIMAAMGAEKTMVEFYKYRGGDLKGRAAFNAMLSSQGSVSLNSLEPFASGVESTKTLKTFFNCAHLKVQL